MRLTAAVNFLDWPASNGLMQAPAPWPERWAPDAEASYRDETGQFVRWSV